MLEESGGRHRLSLPRPRRPSRALAGRARLIPCSACGLDGRTPGACTARTSTPTGTVSRGRPLVPAGCASTTRVGSRCFVSSPSSRRLEERQLPSVRSRTVSRWRTSWYRRPSSSRPFPSRRRPCRATRPGAHRRGSSGTGSARACPARARDGRRGRGSGRRCCRRPRSSTTFSRPIVHSPAKRPLVEPQVLGQRVRRRARDRSRAVAEVRLGRAQVVPVGLRLDADPSTETSVALDAEQLLDERAPIARSVLRRSGGRGSSRPCRRSRAPASSGCRTRSRSRSRCRPRPGSRCRMSFVALRTRSSSCSNENSGVWTPITIRPSSR